MLYFQFREEDISIAVLKRCVEFLESARFPKGEGTAEVGDGIVCIVSRYTTLPDESAFWEAHKRFVDVHCVLEGEERIRVAHTQQSKTGDYHKQQDYLEVEGQTAVDIWMKKGSVLCLFPNDAHQTKVSAHEGDESEVRKAVFKIPLALFD